MQVNRLYRSHEVDGRRQRCSTFPLYVVASGGRPLLRIRQTSARRILHAEWRWATLGGMTELEQLTDNQVHELPIDRLALLVRKHCEETGEWNTHNFLNSARQRRVGQTALVCLPEAMNWLITQGLIGRDMPGQTSAQSILVTRVDKRVLAEGLAGVVAAASGLVGEPNREAGQSLAALKSRKQDFDNECANVDTMLADIARPDDISTVRLEIDRLKRKFDPAGGAA